MEPTELRIGNLIYNGIGEPFKVNAETICNFHIAQSTLGSFKAIPITEEWLLKLNLKKWKNKQIWTIHNVLIYYHTKHGFCYGKANTRTKIKYIHTLQNIIHSLTGKELTINENN